MKVLILGVALLFYVGLFTLKQINTGDFLILCSLLNIWLAISMSGGGEDK